MTKGAWELTDTLHLKAIEVISRSLRATVKGDATASEDMALGRYIAGMGFSNVGLGLVHGMATRKTVDALAGELAEALGPSGIRVGRYHAGMGNDARRQSQRAFIDDDIQVMVATNAFGMGIDKPNVRYVIRTTTCPRASKPTTRRRAAPKPRWRPGQLLLAVERQRFSHAPLSDRPRRCCRRWRRSTTSSARGRSQNRYRLLGQMEGYCNTTGCLREYMLRYFGDEAAAEHAAASTGGTATDDVEELRQLQQLPHAVRGRGRHRYGPRRRALRGHASHALWQVAHADVLHGGNTERIRQMHLDEDRGYGELSSESVGRIKDIIGQLCGRGYLATSQGQYPVVGLGPRAVEVEGRGVRLYR